MMHRGVFSRKNLKNFISYRFFSYLVNIYLNSLYSLHRISGFLFSVFLSLTASGSNPFSLPAGAGEAGMGSVCILRSGFWPSFQNQALLAYHKSFSAGIIYESRFNISELGTRAAGVIIPAGRASLGIIYSNFGYSQFRRETGGIACGLKFSENISAGIQVDYFSEKRGRGI